jgi:hypothetical protein
MESAREIAHQASIIQTAKTCYKQHRGMINKGYEEIAVPVEHCKDPELMVT